MSASESRSPSQRSTVPATPDIPSNSLHKSKESFASWWASGEAWIWINASAVGMSIIAVLGILALISLKGFSHFWPSDLLAVHYHNETGQHYIVGERVDEEVISRQQFEESRGLDSKALPEIIERWLIKTGNRKVAAPDFRWIETYQIEKLDTPSGLIAIERSEWGNAYGRLTSVTVDNKTEVEHSRMWSTFQEALNRAANIRKQIRQLEKKQINAINYRLNRLRLERRRLNLYPPSPEALAQELAGLDALETQLHTHYKTLEQKLHRLQQDLTRDQISLKIMDGREIPMNLSSLIRAWQPNDMTLWQKSAFYLSSFGEFLTDDPREANTEGGIFPAIFGTILMVLLMTVLVTPFGVIAAIYLREYAHQGAFVKLIRIAVNNLAGVPSIVYGVFGLGFFVYFIGGNLDRLFFPEALPAPTFGTPGLLWASLTLALLTVPVVIVSTEEGLTRIPRSLREGSLALGATKAETLFKVILPMAMPSMLTGVILAVARAAGEVAPLMLVGVVKLAPTLPLDGNFPYLHLERKFMHLGFHIYDVGFQSPNVEAARPLVFATALLLVLIIIILNLTAILLRNRLESRFRGVEA